jgi:hypothetical protein
MEELFDEKKELPLNRFVGTHPSHILKGPCPQIDGRGIIPMITPIYIDLIDIADGKGFLAGGAVRNLFYPDQKGVSDFDFYAYKPEDREALKDNFLRAGFELKRDLNNCWWLEKDYRSKYFFAKKKRVSVQIIKTFCGTPEQVVDEFDFTVCRIAWTGSMFCWDKDFFENNEKKILIIKTIQCPIGAIRRIIKYSKKGFWISNVQIVKLFENYIGRGNDWRAKLIELLSKQEEGLTEDEVTQLYEILVGVD